MRRVPSDPFIRELFCTLRDMNAGFPGRRRRDYNISVYRRVQKYQWTSVHPSDSWSELQKYLEEQSHG